MFQQNNNVDRVKLNENIGKAIDALPPLNRIPFFPHMEYTWNNEDVNYDMVYHFIYEMDDIPIILYSNNTHDCYMFKFPDDIVKKPTLLVFEADNSSVSTRANIEVYMAVIGIGEKKKVRLTRLIEVKTFGKIRDLIRTIDFFTLKRGDESNLVKAMENFK